MQADVLTRSAACCQLSKTVFISYGLPHTVKTIEACQRSMEHPSVYVVLSWQRCMGPRSWCIAAGASAVRFLCLVVRDSRMWCPHDIGRDSWVWGEQETLWMMNSPHEVGEEASSLIGPRCREKTGWPTGKIVECYCYLKNNYC